MLALGCGPDSIWIAGEVVVRVKAGLLRKFQCRGRGERGVSRCHGVPYASVCGFGSGGFRRAA